MRCCSSDFKQAPSEASEIHQRSDVKTEADVVWMTIQKVFNICACGLSWDAALAASAWPPRTATMQISRSNVAAWPCKVMSLSHKVSMRLSPGADEPSVSGSGCGGAGGLLGVWGFLLVFLSAFACMQASSVNVIHELKSTKILSTFFKTLIEVGTGIGCTV